MKSVAATPQGYLQEFGLREHPFRLAPNAQFIYRTKATEEALRHGRLVITSRLGFGAVSGEIGLGKTTLARLFAAEAGTEDAVAFLYRVPGGSRQTEAQILLEITQDLGIEERDRRNAETSLRKIENFAYAQKQQERTVVVMIDDAHLLRANGIATVLALLGLAAQAHSLVQIMLFGQAPELMQVIHSDRALHSRLAMHTELTRLSKPEIQAMIEHRLLSAGRQAELFSPAAQGALYRHSHGVPRIACALANRAATFAYEAGARSITDKHIATAAARLKHAALND